MRCFTFSKKEFFNFLMQNGPFRQFFAEDKPAQLNEQTVATVKKQQKQHMT